MRTSSTSEAIMYDVDPYDQIQISELGRANQQARAFHKRADAGKPVECPRFRSWPKAAKGGLSHYVTKAECITRHHRFKSEGPSYHPCAVCSTAATWARYQKPTGEEPMKCNVCKSDKPGEFKSLKTGGPMKTCPDCQEKHLGYKKLATPAPAAIEQPVKVELKPEPMTDALEGFTEYQPYRQPKWAAPTVTLTQYGVIYLSQSAAAALGVDKEQHGIRLFYRAEDRQVALKVALKGSEPGTLASAKNKSTVQISGVGFRNKFELDDVGTYELQIVAPGLGIVDLKTPIVKTAA
jgi:hypothetical protein